MKKIILVAISLLLVLSYSCKKQDNELKQVVSKLVINPSTINLVEGGATTTLKAYALPKSIGKVAISWSVENSNIATVDDSGVITPIKVGTTIVTAKTDNNIKALCTVNVSKNIIAVTGLSIEDAPDKGFVLVVGDSKTLAVNITPANATTTDLTWKSSNEKVASVEEGVVTASKAGKATITAIADNGVKVKCLINVTDKEIEASSITLSVDKATVKEGETKVLNAEILPENTTITKLLWTSSDESIVTVAKTGQVKAIAGGSATITAKTDNGLTATCIITVDPIIWATSINIVGKSEMAIEGEQTLTFNFLPENAENEEFIFVSSKPEVASIDEKGHVIALTAGITTISVSTDNNISTTIDITVNPANPPFVYEGRTYKTVLIDGVTWMAENFAYLPEVTKLDTRSTDDACAYVYDYDGDSVNDAKATEYYKTYGVIYNFAAAVAYCPAGWHLPTQEEWAALEKANGMTDSEIADDSYSGRGDIANKFKSTKIWSTPGTNDTGLNIIPAGYMNSGYGDRANKFTQKDSYAKVWTGTTSESLKSYAYARGFKDYDNKIVANDGPKSNANSVRYVKDSE